MTFERPAPHEYYQRAWRAARGGRAPALRGRDHGRHLFALLRAIEARRFDVFARRVTVSTPRRLAIALAAGSGPA